MINVKSVVSQANSYFGSVQAAVTGRLKDLLQRSVLTPFCTGAAAPICNCHFDIVRILDPVTILYVILLVNFCIMRVVVNHGVMLW